MKARIILLLVIALIVIGGSTDTFATFNNQHSEIEAVIIRAVEDDSWLNASSEEELAQYFQQLFTPELARELTQNNWPFFAEPTGFTEKALVSQARTTASGKKAQTIAQLELYYTGTQEPQLEATGTGSFSLVYLDQRWLIEQMDFTWEYLD